MCFFFNDTATTEIYTLSLHDALPICQKSALIVIVLMVTVSTGLNVLGPYLLGLAIDRYILPGDLPGLARISLLIDRKSTRLNSSHANISYAVFCLKKKNKS